MESQSNKAMAFLKKQGIVLAMILVYLVFAVISPQFRTFSNFILLFRQIATIAVMGAGMTFAIIGGNFDLSVGSLLSLCAVICISMHDAIGPIPAILITLVVGMLSGVVSGFLCGYLRLNSMIVTLGMMNVLEENNLLYNNTDNTFVGSGGLGLTDTLHADPAHITLKTMWGLCEAQECGEISPEMFHEFIFPYHKQVAELFGLNCYACCEGIDTKWQWIKDLPNMRRISVSQWSDMAKMSDYLLKDYVYSYKANSAHVTMPDMNEDIIRRELRNMFEKTKQNENHVEVVLKDLHTISDKPEQVIRWVEIAREELNRLY